MGLESNLRGIFNAVMPFVLARKKESGGFGATPRLPATIEDTYHALQILQLARQNEAVDEREWQFPDGELHSYLSACLRIPGTSTRTFSQLLRCCKGVGLTLDWQTVARVVAEKMEAADSLAEWYFCARICDAVLGEKFLPSAGEARLTVVLGREWRGVDEAWMHLYLSMQFLPDPPPPTPEQIAWFKACQNGDGGFGFFPGTTSYVENCHACLRSLAALGERPRRPELALRFLCGCQNASGGFGRNSRTTAFLDATWHALASLALIA